MASAWRIRHKLILGLALVVGIMAVLLTGSLKGLRAYSATLKSVDSKLAELAKAQILETTVGELGQSLDPAKLQSPGQMDLIRKEITRAKDELRSYENQLQETLDLQRDPNKGVHELPLVIELQKGFEKVHLALEAVKGTASMGSRGSDVPSIPVQHLIKVHKDLRARAGLLVETLRDELTARIGDGKRTYRNSMILVIATSVVGSILLISLTRFAYLWIFYPVRELERGVRRVAEGDFEHRIQMNSGDEMQDLAGAFNDMTARLHEMYRDLAQQVNERSRQLVRSERLASVGFLAAGVAHEINNPLASIAFCSEALERRLQEIVDTSGNPKSDIRNPKAEWATITKYLGMIQQEAFRCKEITQRLLEFSRGGERKREPTNLADLVQGVLDMVQHLQNGKGKRIIFEPASRMVAWVNGQELKSVVLNLVVNALDSMDEGGELTITLRATADRLIEMTFADTGCGMTTEVLENIFEPFYTRSRTGKGTGLGLSISHRVISQHGGEIEAASRGPGQGSTFTVRMPVQPAESVKEERIGRRAA